MKRMGCTWVRLLPLLTPQEQYAERVRIMPYSSYRYILERVGTQVSIQNFDVVETVDATKTSKGFRLLPSPFPSFVHLFADFFSDVFLL